MEGASVPEGKYRFANDIFPIMKTITRPFKSSLIFSAVKEVLIKEAVPYLVEEFFEIRLKYELIRLQSQNVFSLI